MSDITTETFAQIALEAYKPKVVHEFTVFMNDLKRISYLKKFFSQWEDSEDDATTMAIINQFITLCNLFEIDELIRLVFFRIQDQHYGAFSEILREIDKLPETVYINDRCIIYTETLFCNKFKRRLARIK